MFRDEAYVLRRIDWSETSQIASVLTREHGHRRLMAKGSRAERKKGQGARGLDLFCRVAVSIYPKEGDALDLLGEWEALDYHGRLRENLDAIHLALYLGEFLDAVCPADEPVPEVYDAYRETLGRLSRRPAPFFAGLVRIVAALGYAPPPGACVGCGRDVSRLAPLRFAPGEGGVLCRDCRPESERSFPIAPGSARLLAVLAEADPTRLGISAAQASEVWRCLSSMVREIAERRLRLEPEVDRLFGLARAEPAPALSRRA